MNQLSEGKKEGKEEEETETALDGELSTVSEQTLYLDVLQLMELYYSLCPTQSQLAHFDVSRLMDDVATNAEDVNYSIVSAPEAELMLAAMVTSFIIFLYYLILTDNFMDFNRRLFDSGTAGQSLNSASSGVRSTLSSSSQMQWCIGNGTRN